MTSEPPAPRQLAWEAVRSGHRGTSDRDVVPPVPRSVPRSCHLGRVVSLPPSPALVHPVPVPVELLGLRRGSGRGHRAGAVHLSPFFVWCCRLPVARLSESWAGRVRGRLTSAGGIPLPPDGELGCRCCSAMGPHICSSSSKDVGTWKPPTTDHASESGCRRGSADPLEYSQRTHSSRGGRTE